MLIGFYKIEKFLEEEPTNQRVLLFMITFNPIFCLVYLFVLMGEAKNRASNSPLH